MEAIGQGGEEVQNTVLSEAEPKLCDDVAAEQAVEELGSAVSDNSKPMEDVSASVDCPNMKLDEPELKKTDVCLALGLEKVSLTTGDDEKGKSISIIAESESEEASSSSSSSSSSEDGVAGELEEGLQTKDPIRSKNELKELPPVPAVDVSLEPHHITLPVGVVLSVMGAQVIVEGMEQHSPLTEGSILWITEKRTPLGLVDEIFGPVKCPYYIVRFNSESEVPEGVSQGTPVSFVADFAQHILNIKELQKKGYDASGDNDEEIPDELEFSDDEKEAEYRRMQKMEKRGMMMNDQKNGNGRNKKKKNREHGRPENQGSSSLSSNRCDPQMGGGPVSNHQARPPQMDGGFPQNNGAWRPPQSNQQNPYQLPPMRPPNQMGMPI
ncbi:hypothetical protein Rs2_48651 [Raphanus sativus]|nr:hypothetical protein Rs2_48651 [Raphanus sativus]